MAEPLVIPNVEPGDVRPSIEEVSLLERTRTVGSGGGEKMTFDETTRPTADEVELLIDQATEAILGQLPTRLAPIYYQRARHQIALYTAILIEASFFRESLDQGSAALYQRMLTSGMENLVEATGGIGGDAARKTVESVLQVGVAASEDPFLPMFRQFGSYGY